IPASETDQLAVLLQVISDFVQQLRAEQVSMRIVNLFKMVQVDENDREFVVVALRAVNLRLKNKDHVSRVIERRAIVGDGWLVNLLNVPRIFEGNRLRIRKRLQQRQVARIECSRTRAITQFANPAAGVGAPPLPSEER